MNTPKSTNDAVIEKLQEIMRKSESENNVQDINLNVTRVSNSIGSNMAEKQSSIQNEPISRASYTRVRMCCIC